MSNLHVYSGPGILAPIQKVIKVVPKVTCNESECDKYRKPFELDSRYCSSCGVDVHYGDGEEYEDESPSEEEANALFKDVFYGLFIVKGKTTPKNFRIYFPKVSPRSPEAHRPYIDSNSSDYTLFFTEPDHIKEALKYFADEYRSQIEALKKLHISLEVKWISHAYVR